MAREEAEEEEDVEITDALRDSWATIQSTMYPGIF